MQTRLAVLLLLALTAGCENRRADADSDETGAANGGRSGVDTVITTDKIQDTTVIRADTSIDVDTVKDTDHIKGENR
ncbi:MAG TPA: hypothetical protein VEB59_00680 [Gemmatimonadales bacterium]|nr:hypothetical protein [Gemmatimonadales bacterium]